MAKRRTKTVGEGGTHSHRLANGQETEIDGIHKHLFFINDRLMMTDLDGRHAHEIDASNNKVGPELTQHSHTLSVRTMEGVVEFQTMQGLPHQHELQSDGTTVSGLHTHLIEFMDDIHISLLPSDLIAEVKSLLSEKKKFKNFKLKRDKKYPIELDFQLIKKLNHEKISKYLERAVVKTTIKRMTQLAEGLRIESLILSRERFSDIGIATRFVLDNGLDVLSSEAIAGEGVFTFQVMERKRFSETSLQRIRITEGVEAVIGFLIEDGPADQIGKKKVKTKKKKKKSLDDTFNELEDFFGDDDTDKNVHRRKPRKDKKKRIDKKLKNTITKKNGKTSYYAPIIKRDEMKRLITGPVLIPENIDLQDDIISVGEIEMASIGYMVKLAFRDDPEFLESVGLTTKSERGFMHVEFSRKIAVVENYLAPIDFELNGRFIVKGTWIMTMKVFDDEAWNLIKAGKINGFSIGGRAKSTSEIVEG